VKILSITIDQFKKFTLPTQLEGFGEGLNVISGPNEMGKSTILEAIKAVLFERHKSKNAVIKSFQHVSNDTAPIISLVFELDGIQYKIEKRFIKSPYAKLTMPDKVVDGDEAEDILQQLLGFNQAGKSGASPDTLGLWSVLWVRQGESLYAELSDLACNTVQSCLEAEVGILTGGQRGQKLLPAIETALSEIVDKRDKPKSRYREVIDQLAVVEAQLVEFKSKYAVIDEDLTQLDRYRRELQSLQDSEAESKIIEEIESARRRHKEVSAIQTEISIIEKEIKLYRNELETKQKIIEERENLLKEFEQAKKEAEQASEAIEVKASNEKQYSKAVSDLKQELRTDELSQVRSAVWAAV
jgi:DNA repair exonuclease SbcCD ATPase subunit